MIVRKWLIRLKKKGMIKISLNKLVVNTKRESLPK
jgi:hypothetical protein